MTYSDENIKIITEKKKEIFSIHKNLLLNFSTLNSKLKEKKATEYLMQGAFYGVLFHKNHKSILQIP